MDLTKVSRSSLHKDASLTMKCPFKDGARVKMRKVPVPPAAMKASKFARL